MARVPKFRKSVETALVALPLAALLAAGGWARAEPLGLPKVPVPADNPQSPEKVALGDKLFHDARFSIDGTVSCSTCHNDKKAFTDSPLRVSEGHNKLTGTRNAPSVINAAYYTSQFWDGRSISLEDQSQHPMVNPVEMGLPDHEPVLKIVREDPAYVEGFKKAFGKSGRDVTMDDVKKAIASFERTIISGDSPFDKWYFGQGRCVSCHVVEQTQALFTDNRFHNIGVGINRIQNDVPRLAAEFLKAKAAGASVDKTVLADPKVSELGRFAVTNSFDEIGAFKTTTLRNIAMTAPYMHDGSLKTLKDVVKHYNEGGKSPGDPAPVNPYLSGGIRPLDLKDQQIDDLVAFLETLTSPAYVTAQTK